jgi:hypothetical protein
LPQRDFFVIPSSNGTFAAGATGTDFGNVGRNVLRGPGQTNVDFSVIKRFPFRESRNIETRAEFFNLFNHANFANPISNLSAVPSTSIDPNSDGIIGSPGDFGRIISTSNNPRLIQFAMKLNFLMCSISVAAEVVFARPGGTIQNHT